VLAIPGYGLAEAGLEADFGVPDEVALDLGVVQGVAEVVAGAVGDEGEEGGGRGTGRVRRRRTEDGEEEQVEVETGEVEVKVKVESRQEDEIEEGEAEGWRGFSVVIGSASRHEMKRG
jgi:hypothetical protein